MKKNAILRFVIILLPLFLVTGCLKDNVNPANSFITTNSIDMLIYLESNGDIINSRNTLSAFVYASDLYSNLLNYVILDIRDPQLFADGHIAGAVNIQSSDLLAEVKSNNTTKVILVSQNGQSASYYGGLLRLDGQNNVYILKFGMAGWNNHFAAQWMTYNGDRGETGHFNNVLYNKGSYTDLPEVTLSSSGNIQSKIENRIQSLLSETFEDGVTYQNSSLISAYSQDVFDENIYSPFDSTFGDQYIACYDTVTNYTYPKADVTIPQHPPHSVLYTYYSDLKSIYYLQTIPNNKKVVIYSLDGHQSAFATAYLRLLGYTNVRSLLFGATWMSPFPGSMNYPYVN